MTDGVAGGAARLLRDRAEPTPRPMSVPTPFQTLGVAPSATPDEVRRAFRQRAFALHPDRNPSPTATDDFRTLRAAYDVILSGAPKADGFDVDRIASDIEAAALAADRRRTSGTPVVSAWQPMRVPLERTPRERLTDGFATPRGRTGVTVALGAGVLVAGGIVFVGGFSVLSLALALIATVASAAAGAATAWNADDRPWAVDTHWRGVRDLRWDATVEWAEIRAVQEGDGWLDLLITEAAALRLRRSVPPQTLVRVRPVGAEAPVAYRLPIRTTAPLAGAVRTQLANALAA